MDKDGHLEPTLNPARDQKQLTSVELQPKILFSGMDRETITQNLQISLEMPSTLLLNLMDIVLEKI
jgi:hypothetical protein